MDAAVLLFLMKPSHEIVYTLTLISILVISTRDTVLITFNSAIISST